jgi:hypothetical protein
MATAGTAPGIGRRAFLAGAGAAVALPAEAGLVCTGFTEAGPGGVQRCTVGVPSLTVQGAGQLCRYWCWAACIQSLFATTGFVIADQQRIVQALFGRRDVCATATGAQIIRLINRDWQADDGRWFRAWAQPLLDLTLGLHNANVAQGVAWDLANGFPLINGALGHATLLTAMTYLTDRTGLSKGILDITVRDPWVPAGQPAAPRSLTAAELHSTFFVAQVRVYA